MWIHPEKPGEKLFDEEWVFDRCREVQFGGEDVIDIWFRGSCKSTIKTFGRTIFRILQNPNRTIGIFSVTANIATSFLKQIKTEFEENSFLIDLYPDVLYADPRKESKTWNLQVGITVKRSLNLRDCTISAYGLLDSNYTGARITDGVYDDVVNEHSVTTPDMSRKVTDQWDLSLDIGMPGTVRCYSGTFYLYGDTYHDIAGRGTRVRLYPCYEIDYEKSRFDDNGLPQKLEFFYDKPVLYSAEYFGDKEKTKSPKIFGAQFLCNPLAASAKSFQISWIQTYTSDRVATGRGHNVYLLVDPAGSSKKGRSFFVMWAVGLGNDQNYYILDGIIDRLDLSQRTDALFEFHQRWQPIEVRYEQYAFQSDIEHIEYVMGIRNYRFEITLVAGNIKKEDRIERLLPIFKAHRFYFPVTIPYYSRHEGKEIDIIETFRETEFAVWPEGIRDDGLDSLSRIAEPDLPLQFPKFRRNPQLDSYRQAREVQMLNRRTSGSWMSQ